MSRGGFKNPSRADAKTGALAGVSAAAVMGVGVETEYLVEARNAAGELLWTETCKNRVVTVGLNKLLDATLKTGLTAPAWYIGLVGPSITDAAITAADATLTSASNPFTAGDAGRAIIVRGAGAAGADLTTTILSYTSAGSVELAVNASTTVVAGRALWDARAADTSASHTPWTEVTAYDEATRQAFTPGTISAGSVDNSAAKAVFTISADNTYVGGAFMIDNSTKGGSTGVLYGMAPFTSGGIRQLMDNDTLSVQATPSLTAT